MITLLSLVDQRITYLSLKQINENISIYKKDLYIFHRIHIYTNRLTSPFIIKEEITMIQVIPGDTGEGKTKELIEEANSKLNETNGNIVYIDADNTHMYDLKHEIRYINISEFPINNYHEFFGFMCGILSEDNDIDYIFVDGLLRMAHLNQIDNSDELIEKLKLITNKFGVKLVASINCKQKNLPQFLQEFSMA
jgi:hypothetical protein